VSTPCNGIPRRTIGVSVRITLATLVSPGASTA